MVGDERRRPDGRRRLPDRLSTVAAAAAAASMFSPAWSPVHRVDQAWHTSARLGTERGECWSLTLPRRLSDVAAAGTALLRCSAARG